MRTRKIVIFILSIFLSTAVFANSAVPLSISSVHEEMDRIFKDHLTKKEMTPALMQESLEHYIQQFDPYEVYLLNEEVIPYFQLSTAQANFAVNEYKANKFPLFVSATQVIQQAIYRMRAFRRNLSVDENRFAELARQPLNVKIETLTGFVDSKETLLARHAIYMAQLVIRFQNEAIKTKRDISFKEVVRTVELQIEEQENNYLYLDRLGRPMDARTKEEQFVFHLLKAFTASLDAHTRYLNPQEASDLRMKLEKNYVGVGIALEELGKAFVVASIVKGSSADTTGAIHVGDEIVSIDNTPVSHLTLPIVEGLLEGQANTSVHLELQRRSSNGMYKIPVSVTLQRRAVEIKEGRVDTSFQAVSGGIIGIINLHAFYQGTSDVTSEKDVLQALDLLSKKGKMKGLILDLRDNRGGFLMQAVKVAGLFIKSGVVVAAKYSNGEIHYFRDLDPSVAYSGPLIVLISKETASAAEIVAQALKDYGVAIIVGDKKSFGKGSIQMQTVTHGANEESYFKVTVGRYYSVSGKSTQLEGVKADIVVPSILAERKYGEEYLEDALPTDSIKPSYDDPLTDIPEADKKWYQRYYVPFIQPKIDTYRKWIPELAKLSRERLDKNSNYQHLLHGDHFIIERKGLVETKRELDQESLRKEFRAYQLEETVNIMKDLIHLDGNR